MKRAIIVGLALIPMLLFTASCGVSQTEYDRVSSELAAAQAEVQSLQDNLTEAQAQIESLQSDKEAAEQKLAQSGAKIEILNAIFIPAITGELDEMTETEAVNYFFEWRDKVMAVGDPALEAKFQAIIDSFSDQALTDFFVYLLESTAEGLE